MCDCRRGVLQLQVYVNGHGWLAQHGVRYTKHDNAFLWLEDFARAQRSSDRCVSLPWIALRDRYARRVNLLLRDVLPSMQCYWVTAEYPTDLVFKSRAQLADFVPRLLDHSTSCVQHQECRLGHERVPVQPHDPVDQRLEQRRIDARGGLVEQDEPRPGDQHARPMRSPRNRMAPASGASAPRSRSKNGSCPRRSGR